MDSEVNIFIYILLVELFWSINANAAIWLAELLS